jgi:large subunit ribosomal protein L4
MPRTRIPGQLDRKLFNPSKIIRLPLRVSLPRTLLDYFSPLQHPASSTGTIRHVSSVPRLDKYPNPILYDPALLPRRNVAPDAPSGLFQVSTVPAHLAKPSVPITLHAFPSGEPIRVLQYPSSHLHLPLRRDLLHRAIIYEANRTRQGTHHTKWRSDVHKSGRKVRPQKGSGKARLGDAKSPMLKGGGVAHGPKDRDHSTGLPKKIYDLAWRTALSHRYRKGQLLVINGSLAEAWSGENGTARPEAVIHLHELFRGPDEKLTTLYIGLEGIKDKLQDPLHQALEAYSPKDRVRYAFIDTDELDVRGRPRRERFVDVKNLLESSRIVIEKAALDKLLTDHQSDLGPVLEVGKAKAEFEEHAPAMIQAVQEYRAQRTQAAKEKLAAREAVLEARKIRREEKSEKKLKLDTSPTP